jgi:hypothetical protein
MTLNVQSGLPPLFSRSYAYDNTNYIQADPVSFSLAATASSNAKFTAFVKKQLRSITAVPTVANLTNDNGLTLTLVSLYPQAFGTATGGSYVGSGTYVVGVQAGASGTLTGGTQTATGSNTVTIGPFTSFGTSPAFNPSYIPLDNGTATVVVANGVGTNTQTGYVFPTGPAGGLTVNPGDVLTIAKGTDTQGVFQCEAEFTFTPGSFFTI